MKSIISTTYDDKYLWFVPLTTFLWNKLGVDVICFMPYLNTSDENKKIDLINDTFRGIGIKIQYAGFSSPKHKEATYAQCLRNYAACLDLDEDEFLITSDIDMGLFRLPLTDIVWDKFQILGTDLVPKGQYPVCYCGATVKIWREVFELNDKTYQQAIDELLGDDECQDYRACRWSVDQEQLYLKISQHNRFEIPRAREGTTFAANRLDRDDAYLLERMDDNIIDFHFPRPAYEEKNFEIIMTVLRHYFPLDDFSWLINYNNEYKKLL